MPGPESHGRTAWISETEKVVSFTRRLGYEALEFASHELMLQFVVSLGRKGYGII